MRSYLSFENIIGLFDDLDRKAVVEFVRIRPHNGAGIRRRDAAVLEDLLEEISRSITEGHIYGGDLEIPLHAKQRRLIGHHDGLYWLDSLPVGRMRSGDRADGAD